jgi:predicted nucleic acid-binding protein
MTLVDTSVLLDVLLDDPTFGTMSENALRDARRLAGLVICETVLAEIRPVFASDTEMESFVDDLGLEYRPCPREAAVLAGQMYAQYLKNRGTAKRVVPDFLIGAHASVAGYTLLARDRGYYRSYFHELNVVEPSPIMNG